MRACVRVPPTRLRRLVAVDTLLNGAQVADGHRGERELLRVQDAHAHRDVIGEEVLRDLIYAVEKQAERDSRQEAPE